MHPFLLLILLLEMRYFSLRYNNCYSVSAKCNLFTKYIYCCYSSSPAAPFNKCLIFHYFRCCFFHIFIYYLSPFCLVVLCFFFDGAENARRTKFKKQLDWVSSLLYSFWVKCKRNNNNDYQECFLSFMFYTQQLNGFWKGGKNYHLPTCAAFLRAVLPSPNASSYK